MAKHKNKKSGSMRSSSREPVQNFASDDIGGDEDISSGADMSGGDDRDVEASAGGRDQSQSRMASSSRGGDESRQDFDPKQLLESFRGYIEGHPARATALGAVFGGVAAGLLATDTGRSLLRASFSYARPMISDYARKFVANQTNNAIEKSLPQ